MSQQPTRSRPFLEHLEERTLLDASSGMVAGAPILGSNFAPVAIGLALPIGANVPSTTGVTAQTFPTAGGATALAATSAFVAQNQANSQFRDFAVNSLGEYNQLFQTTTNILLDAYGFGSGTQPNAPWAPAAYNLGLANHQYGYPSQSDVGFSATPPWFHPTSQSLPNDQPLDGDEDSRGQNTVQAAPKEKLAPEEQTISEEAAPAPIRGDSTVEEALFTEPLHTLASAVLANRQDHAAADGPASEDSSIPSLLWISALAPAQMAALVVGLPGAATPTEGGDAGLAAEGSE